MQATPATSLLEVRGLSKFFRLQGRGWGGSEIHRAVDDVSFDVRPDETLGLIGESGSGKSTIGRLILRLIAADAGQVKFEGEDILHASRDRLNQLRRRMQIVMQDPYSALNPRMTIGEFVAEPLVVHGLVRSRSDRREQVAALFEKVGLPADAMDRYPHQFSGGQRQRIAIARAVALKPKFIVADEPTASLDVSIQAQVLNLLQDLRAEFGLAMVFISHDFSVVRHMCQRVAVLRYGRIVELGPSEVLMATPLHPYTRRLVAAVPVADPRLERAREPVPVETPGEDATPHPLREVSPGHFVAMP